MKASSSGNFPILTNFLSHSLNFKDFEIEDFLYTTPGLSCDIALARNTRTSQSFLVKITSFSDQSEETLMLSELELLAKLNMHPFKPKSIPVYFGYAKEEHPDKVVYNIVYELLEMNLKKTIKARTVKNELVDFELIEQAFTSMVNTLAFLQSLEIIPARLDSDGLFHTNKHKILKPLDFCQEEDFLQAVISQTARNTIYLPPEVLKSMRKAQKQADGSPIVLKSNGFYPHKASTYSLGLCILELLTLQTPKSVKTLENDIMRLLTEANLRYANFKNPMKVKCFLQLLSEVLRVDPSDRPDSKTLFWKNCELRNSGFGGSSHLLHHVFIEDGDCSEIRLFNELKSKGKPFKVVDINNPGDEFFGLGQITLEGREFSDKGSLEALISEIRPLRGVNIRTIRGNIDKDFRYWDDVVLNTENWDLENLPIRKLEFQGNVHEKLVDDEYKKYYFNVFIKRTIKGSETCEDGAIKILHQHDWNFMEGVHDDTLEPVIERMMPFVKGNKRLEKFSFLIQRITEKTVIGIKKLLEELCFDKLEYLDFGFQLKSFKNQEVLKDIFRILDEKLEQLGFTPPLKTFIFSVNTWDVQDAYLPGLCRFLHHLKNLKHLHLNMKEITKENTSLQGSFPDALKTVLPDLKTFSLALRSEEKPYIDDDSLNKLVLTFASYMPKKLDSFSFFFDSGGVIERTIETLYEIIKDRTFKSVNFCYRGKWIHNELKGPVVQKKFTQALVKNKTLVKIGAMQFLFCGCGDKK